MSHSLADLFLTYRHAYLAALLIALGCSVVGVYVALRRVAFVGIATAQLAAAGTAAAFLFHAPPLPAAIVTALLGVALFARGRASARLPRDGVVGVTFVIASALAVLFVSRSGAELDQVEHIIYGSLLFTTQDQVVLLAAGMGLVLLVHALFGREFLMVSCDPETARTLGVRAGLFDLVLFLSLGTVVALSIGTAGSLLAFAFLILPPMTGLAVARRMSTVFAVALVAGLLTAVLGVLGSVLFDLPTGPSIVVAAAALFVAALGFRVRPIVGLATLTLLALLFGWLHATSRPPAPDPHAAPEPVHVDLELAAHDRSVRRGEALHVDYVVRIQGTLDVALHLVLEAGGATLVVPLHGGLGRGTPRRAGRAEFATADLAPGTFVLQASLWTGDPLQPDADTEILAPHVCAGAALPFQVRP